jgi:hypothetical protein
MQGILWISLVIVLGISISAVAGEHQNTLAAPAEQYRALLKQYQNASSGIALSDEERLKLTGSTFKLRNKLALKFVVLAENNPEDPIAVDALIQAVWQVNPTAWPVELVGNDDASVRAFTLLLRDHIRSDKLGSVCQRISFGFRQEYETFLRAVLQKNPHAQVQAQSCLALAHFLNNRLQRLDLVKEQPELAREFENLFGEAYLKTLQRQDRDQVIKEAETLFELAVTKYGDVKIPGGPVVGEKAKAALFEIRNLVIGREAPDIQGMDQDGVAFKLSDYRGKVVLLDFWHQQ